jgi:hypothetical protein
MNSMTTKMSQKTRSKNSQQTKKKKTHFILIFIKKI